MSHIVKLPLYLSWGALKKLLGWPYGRSHTERLETDPKYHKGVPFPRRGRPTGGGRHAHPMWYTPDVLEYFKRRGLRVPELVEYSYQ
jgi:hypothetical protein